MLDWLNAEPRNWGIKKTTLLTDLKLIRKLNAEAMYDLHGELAEAVETAREVREHSDDPQARLAANKQLIVTLGLDDVAKQVAEYEVAQAIQRSDVTLRAELASKLRSVIDGDGAPPSGSESYLVVQEAEKVSQGSQLSGDERVSGSG